VKGNAALGGVASASPARLEKHRMTDQRPPTPKPALGRNDRYLLGAVVVAAMVVGLVLYNTRGREEPTNQRGVISAPEAPGSPGGRK